MQALAAACKTVDCLKIVHSLHAYFLLLGDFNSMYPYKHSSLDISTVIILLLILNSDMLSPVCTLLSILFLSI